MGDICGAHVEERIGRRHAETTRAHVGQTDEDEGRSEAQGRARSCARQEGAGGEGGASGEEMESEEGESLIQTCAGAREPLPGCSIHCGGRT